MRDYLSVGSIGRMKIDKKRNKAKKLVRTKPAGGWPPCEWCQRKVKRPSWFLILEDGCWGVLCWNCEKMGEDIGLRIRGVEVDPKTGKHRNERSDPMWIGK